MDFHSFFQKLTGLDPLPWQLRFASGDIPDLIDIPTGLGKTAGIVVGWRARRAMDPENTPRRLVYCLPMRSLVEQTAESCRRWAAAEEHAFDVHVLMGGDVDEAYIRAPERDSVLIGTQDMLLSRALNRGFSMSRYSWSMSFGLVHNDALWVFDETQLQGVGVETGAQLQGFRDIFGTSRPTHTVWASATLDEQRIFTVDASKGPRARLTLDDEDFANALVQQRLGAVKTLNWSSDELLTDGEVASHAVEVHVQGTLTLVVVNRVARAQSIFQSLQKSFKAMEKSGLPGGWHDLPAIALVHSRFRGVDRAQNEALLKGTGNRIIVATQAVEAGMDVSARTMVTEVAPWASLVQRWGRVNRYGEHDASEIHLVRVDASKPASAAPYDGDELVAAEKELARMIDAGGDASITGLQDYGVEERKKVRPVIRRRDLLELFDTTSDLSGLDLDVSSFIRDDESLDIQVFWRDFDESTLADVSRPAREELVSVSISNARAYLAKLIKEAREHVKDGQRDKSLTRFPYVFDHLEGKWTSLTEDLIRPGIVVLLHASVQGYTSDIGFTGALKGAGALAVPSTTTESPASIGQDRESQTGVWVTLADHLQHVMDEADAIARAIGVSEAAREVLQTVAAWHDVGKAHEVFQSALNVSASDNPNALYAKSGTTYSRYKRRGFRHELASALAWDAWAPADYPERSLITWLIATHHGKVRLSLRALPYEKEPPQGGPFARGVWEGDTLPAVDVPRFGRVETHRLSLAALSLGEKSWVSQGLELRDRKDLGVFRISWLEALLRAADQRASAKEAGHE